MPQTAWTTNVVPVAPAWRPLDDEEALLGTSTSFFEHFLLGQLKPAARRAGIRNNRQTSPGRATQNLYFGAITARNAPYSQLGNQFAGPYLAIDTVLGYGPHALRDPEEYETRLYAKPGRWDQLSTLPAPPNIAAITGATRTRSTWEQFLGGFIQTQFVVNPSVYADPPDPPGSLTRKSQVPLPFSPDPTPPPFKTDAIPAEVLPHPPQALTPTLPFSPAPVPPRVGTNRIPPEVLDHLPDLFQPPLVAVVPPPNPPPVIASNRIPAEELPHPAAIRVPLPFSPAPVPPPFSANRIPAEVLPHPGAVVQALRFTPAPTPPKIASNAIPAEVLPHLGQLLDFLPFSPAPTPPQQDTNRTPAEALFRGPHLFPPPAFVPSPALPAEQPDSALGALDRDEQTITLGLDADSARRTLGAEGLTTNQQGVETDTTGFGNRGFAGSPSVLTRVTSEHYAGAAALQVDTAGALDGEGVDILLPRPATTAGLMYRFTGHVKGAGILRLTLNWYEAGGTQIGFETVVNALACLAGSWQAISGEALAPATTASCRITIATTTPQAVTFFLDGNSFAQLVDVDLSTEPANQAPVTGGLDSGISGPSGS